MIRKIINSTYPTVAIMAYLFIQLSCTTEAPTDLAKTPFIPKPVSVTTAGGVFRLSKSTVIYAREGLEPTANYLSDCIYKSTGILLNVKAVTKPAQKGIYLNLSAGDSVLGSEGYELNIGTKLLTFSANKPEGCFMGIQTLRQLLPVKTGMAKTLFLKIPTGVIRDFPRYGYRGFMLDVSRHFFGVETVKQIIDYLSMYKMNVLHLHLSDDQGWRIEIKSWPNLTTYGGSTEVGGGRGGYYTQEQYRDIVKYARERHITIVPEIDMPGHTNAALASYAELNCSGKAPDLYTGTNVGFSTLCAGKDITYKFIDDVIGELAAMTPGPYIHIGGDESHATKMEDYIPFVKKVQDIVVSHGKKVIGWDDIANSELVPGTTIQYWSNRRNTTRGIEKGAKVIMSPGSKAYLDMKYDSTTTPGQTWAGYIEVNTGYDWDPDKLVPGVPQKDIIGVEAPLWTETVTNLKDIDFMLFPRLLGYAEIGWSAPETRNWEEYKVRLGKQAERFNAMGINYYHSPLVPWIQ